MGRGINTQNCYNKISVFNSNNNFLKITRHTKKLDSVTPAGKITTNKNWLWRAQISGLTLQRTIINMIKELQESMSKEVKEAIMTMSYQIENINKVIEIIKGIIQVEILESKIIITKMKNLREWFNSSFEPEENRITELEDRLIEVMKSKELREKGRKKNEQCLREIWNIIKTCHNSSTKEGRGKKQKKIFEEITTETFPKLLQMINIHI